MRMRRSQNNRPFRRGGSGGGSHKPRGMEGLPADEPDLPPPGVKPAEAAPASPAISPEASKKTATPADPAQPAPVDAGTVAAPAEPPPPPLPPARILEIEKLQAKPTKELKVYAKKEYEIENAATLKKHDLICEILKRNAAKNGTANGGGRARSPPTKATAFSARRGLILRPARRTSTSRRRRCAASACARATSSTARSARRRKRSATSRWPASTRSRARTPSRVSYGPSLICSRRPSEPPHFPRGQEGRRLDARDGPDLPARLWASAA